MLILYLLVAGLTIALAIFLLYKIKEDRIIREIRKDLSLKNRSTIKILNELKNKCNKYNSEILEKERLYEELYYFINNVPFGILTLDLHNHTVIYINETCKELLKIKQNVVGKKYYLICKDYRLLSGIEKALEQFEKSEERNLEEELSLNEVEPKYIKVNYMFPNEISNELLIIMTDITFQREIEEKSAKLISDVAHELRTPLTSIHGFAETLLQPDIEKKDQERFLKIIEAESARLGRLINEILDIVRMDTKKIKISLSAINLSEIINYVAELVQDEAMENNIRIIKDIEPNVKILGNEDKLIQAFLNLVDNAIKYTANVGDTVSIRLTKDKINALLEISDNGPGIPSVYLDKIFERFFRVDKSRARNKVSGSGLGLSIVKSIIEYHNGFIEAESEVGKGATFTIALPLLHGNNNS